MKSKLYIGAILTITAVLVLGPILAEQAYANPNGPNNNGPGNGGPNQGSPINAKVRAIQNGNSLDMDNAGVLGENIWCVGGIDEDSEANDIHCYLLPDGVPTDEYNTHPDVIKRDGDSTNIGSCPDGAGFQASDICFWVLFPASDFPTAGHYRFVAEFTKNGNIIDLAGTDFRNHSFMVVPEFLLGSIGLVGSLLGTFYLYRRRGAKAREEE
ncbi:MAG: hypothetical protein QXH33_03370 [Candidatus Nitrosocaldus sp.]